MVYINGIGAITPQHTLPGDGFLEQIAEHATDFLRCKEPAYRDFINPLAARRMSRLIKMGIAAAKMATGSGHPEDKAEIEPDAIITGTGLGSVEDTEKILGDLTVEEKFLNPTPFIQSTYNTISSQIAITLHCHGYNTTYVHRTLSFESCLLDAILQFREGCASSILAGGIDEMTINHLAITRRLGLWKKETVSNLHLRDSGTPGSIAGEGSTYFLLGKERTPGTYALLRGTDIAFRPDRAFNIASWTNTFLERSGVPSSGIDLLLFGMNGDSRFDPVYTTLADELFPGKPMAWFKHLCGEYHTATGFGMYVGANLIRRQTFPQVLQYLGTVNGKIEHILIYNQYRNTDHSLILLSQC